MSVPQIVSRAASVVLVAAAVLAGGQPSTADAHQPREVADNPVRVVEPEVSKAFYDELTGSPRVYVIDEPSPFQLYLSITVPKRTNPDGRYSAHVYRVASDRTLVASLVADSRPWTDFFEPFGRDWYLQGPELRIPLESGRHEIEVYGNGDRGKYALAIGEREEFPLTEIANSVRVIPRLKVWFFNDSPASFALSIFGASYLVVLSVTGLLIGACLRLTSRVAARGDNRSIGAMGRWVRLLFAAGLLAVSVFTWAPLPILLAGYLIFEARTGWSFLNALQSRRRDTGADT